MASLGAGGGASRYKLTNQNAQLGEAAILKVRQNSFRLLRLRVTGLHLILRMQHTYSSREAVQATVRYRSKSFGLVFNGFFLLSWQIVGHDSFQRYRMLANLAFKLSSVVLLFVIGFLIPLLLYLWLYYKRNYYVMSELSTVSEWKAKLGECMNIRVFTI